jgi:hypothetical protein
VQFRGGHGLLFVTDLDTIAVDIIILGGLCLIAIRVARHGLDPETVVVLLLFSLTTVLLAYEVTNFGTLFRLRQLAVAPFWMLPMVVRHSPVRRCSSVRGT